MYNIKISRSIILLTIIMSVGLSSCNTNKNVITPEVDTNGMYRDGDDSKTDSSTIADIPWKEYFTDQNLQSLISEGLGKNYSLLIAHSRIKQAEASLSMSKAAKLPTLTAGLQTDNTWLSTGNEGTKVLGYEYSGNTTTLGFSASWELDIWGKLRSQTKAQYANFLNSYEYCNLIQTTLIANIAKSYYTLIALDEQLRITKETVVILEESAKTMLALKEAGQQNGAAVEQSNALLYSTQLSIPALESQIRQQENAISILIGRKPGIVERAVIEEQNAPAQLNCGVPVQLLSRRPDVKQAELSFRSAYELTNAAEASLYPSFTISSASIGLGSSSLSDFFKPASILGNITAGISQPIFYKKQLRGNLKIAQAQQEEALLNFQNTVLTAGQEVSDILFSYETSLSKNELREKQIESLNTAVDFTQELLLAGEANYTEVLTAQQSLLSAQLSKVNDRLEQLTYSVSLYKALGGGTK